MASNRSSTAKGSPDIEAQHRKDILRSVASVGPEPSNESPFFTAYNRQNYTIFPNQIIPLSASHAAGTEVEKPDAKKMDKLRRTPGALPRTQINAGSPVASDIGGAGCGEMDDAYSIRQEFRGREDVDGTLHLHELGPLPETLTHRVTYTSPTATTAAGTGGKPLAMHDRQIKKGDPDQFTLSATQEYETPDIVARFIAGRVVDPGNVSVFERYVLGAPWRDGKRQVGKRPDRDGSEEGDRKFWAWKNDQKGVQDAISRLLMVYTEAVEAAWTVAGNVVKHGEISKARKENRLQQPAQFRYPVFGNDGRCGVVKKVDGIVEVRVGTVDTLECAPQLMMGMELLSNTTEEALGRKISGLHDVQRLYPIHGEKLEAVLALVGIYELEKSFPALVRLGAVRGTKAAKTHGTPHSTQLNCDDMHAMHTHTIGRAPDANVNSDEFRAWVLERATHPYAKVWVRERNDQCRHGIRYAMQPSCGTFNACLTSVDGRQPTTERRDPIKRILCKQPWTCEILPIERSENDQETHFASPPDDDSWDFKLVPLLRGRAEELNGTTVLHLADLKECNLELHNRIDAVLRSIMGQKSGGNASGKRQALECSNAEIQALKNAVETLKSDNSSLHTSMVRLRGALEASQKEASELKSQSKKMRVTDATSRHVQFTGESSGTLFVTARAGAIIHDNGEGRSYHDANADEHGTTTLKIIFNAESETKEASAELLALENHSAMHTDA